MNLPSHIVGDLADGMNPIEVFAIDCVRCGEYIAQMQDFDDRPDPCDHNKLCSACDPEGLSDD